MTSREVVQGHLDVRAAGQSAARLFKRLRGQSSNHKWNLYQPLDNDRYEIRLLLVKAGRAWQKVRCELHHASLKADPIPRYETISYCWGDPLIKADIILNGRKTMVPASSKAAIRRMRLPDADRVLWIDAVCINQTDSIERGYQVALMHKVYSNGHCNLIYLGEGDKTTTRDIEIVQKILQNARDETSDYQTWDETVMTDSGMYKLSDTGIELGTDIAPQFNFYSAPWFGRLWVAQEASLSAINTCHCGPRKVALDDVLRAARWLEYKSRFLPFYIPDQPGIQSASGLLYLCDHNPSSFRVSRDEPFTLIEILDNARDLDCKDPRDRIYAILGLHEKLTGTSDLSDSILPDYLRPLRSVQLDAAKFAIQERGDLCIFSYIDIIPFDVSLGESWPSWFPHWHMKEVDDDMPRGLAEIFKADRDNGLNIEAAFGDADPDQLNLAGHLVDTASDVLPACKGDALRDSEGTLDVIGEIQTVLARNAIVIDSTSLGATLIAGTNHVRQRATKENCENFLAWSTYIEETGDLPALPAMGEATEEGRERDCVDEWNYDQAVYTALDNRCFFVTACGSIGLGPRTMQNQVVIAILYGCKWPVALRPKEGFYRILGTCYVHGIMDGEAVKKKEEEGKEPEVIIIR